MVREKATLTAREERERNLRVLLEWYKDALETMSRSGDMAYGGAPGSVCLLMGELWWHRSYRELERVLSEFKVAEPRLWWHVRERFITNTNRTVLMCPTCEQVQEVSAKHFRVNETYDTRTVSLTHKHGGRAVYFVLKSVPVLSEAIRPEAVDAGIRWINEHFKRAVVVPDLILNRDPKAA